MSNTRVTLFIFLCTLHDCGHKWGDEQKRLVEQKRLDEQKRLLKALVAGCTAKCEPKCLLFIVICNSATVTC